MSIRIQLLLSVGLVLLFVVGAAAGMMIMTSSQGQAGVHVDVSGRQRALSQMLAKEALIYARTKAPADGERLKKTMTTFDRSIHALVGGGTVPNAAAGSDREIPAVSDAQALSLGRRQLEIWGAIKAATTKLVDSQGNDAGALDQIVAGNVELFTVANEMTARLAAASGEAAGRLLIGEAFIIGLGLLAGVIALAIGGRVSTAIISLTDLGEAISQGKVDTAIDVKGPGEIGSLGKSLDRMRVSLKKSMDMLQQRQGKAA